MSCSIWTLGPSRLFPPPTCFLAWVAGKVSPSAPVWRRGRTGPVEEWEIIRFGLPNHRLSRDQASLTREKSTHCLRIGISQTTIIRRRIRVAQSLNHSDSRWIKLNQTNFYCFLFLKECLYFYWLLFQFPGKRKCLLTKAFHPNARLSFSFVISRSCIGSLGGQSVWWETAGGPFYPKFRRKNKRFKQKFAEMRFVRNWILPIMIFSAIFNKKKEAWQNIPTCLPPICIVLCSCQPNK